MSTLLLLLSACDQGTVQSLQSFPPSAATNPTTLEKPLPTTAIAAGSATSPQQAEPPRQPPTLQSAPSTQAAPEPTPTEPSLTQQTSTGQTSTGQTPTQQTQLRMAGFSQTGRHYLVLEGWRDQGAGIPTAALQIVELPTNTCLAQGCIRTRFGERDAHLSLAAAEATVLTRTRPLRQALQIEHPQAGIALPIVARSRQNDGTELVRVQVGPGSDVMQIRLHQNPVASTLADNTAREQTALQLEMTYRGHSRSLNSLTQRPDQVLNFSIREVQRSADGKGAVILLDATQPGFEGNLKRTLVQGFTF